MIRILAKKYGDKLSYTQDMASCSKSPGYNRHYCEETWQIWAEAGFQPPAIYRLLVELLHNIKMYGRADHALLEQICDNIKKNRSTRSHAGEDGFVVTDSKRLRDMAVSFNIMITGRSEITVAEEIACAIIAEYAK